jgi:endonuclease III
MNNYSSVLSEFEKNYKEIPLEIFKDPYKILISTLMSSRTKDSVTLTRANELFIIAPNIYALNRLSEEKIKKIIYPVGFYKIKAKHIKQLAKEIIDNHKGIVPDKYDYLITLQGVGRKTANLVLNRAFNVPAIAVDTHVHQISNLLGWVKTNKPEETEKELMKILPKKDWSRVNRLMVSIGQQYPNKNKLIEFLRHSGLDPESMSLRGAYATKQSEN